MNKRTINKEVYENYVDATVALLMECYAVDTLEESIQAELSAEKCEQVEFSAQLDDRCRRLLKKEMTRSNTKKYLKKCLKGLRYAAASLVLLLALSSVLFMTVEAVRVPVMNYFIEEQDGHWEISKESSAGASRVSNAVDLDKLLSDLIGKDYYLIVQEDSLNESTVIYENTSGIRIFCKAVSGNNWIAIDSEDAEISHQHSISGYDAITVVKDGTTTLTWVHANLGKVFILAADDMGEDEILRLGEQLISALD